MMRGLWGRKIGMTQIFSEDKKVVPATAIDVSNWYIVQLKNTETDGYNAVKLGCVKERYSAEAFSTDWIKQAKKYFVALKEVRVESLPAEATIGQQADLGAILSKGDHVDVLGISKGAGFQGVVKRHNFAGGPASHGSKFGRIPGALANYHTKGKVEKNKKMPGHMGVESKVIKNLKVVKIEPTSNVLLINGSVPGKSGSLVYIKKSVR